MTAAKYCCSASGCSCNIQDRFASTTYYHGGLHDRQRQLHQYHQGTEEFRRASAKRLSRLAQETGCIDRCHTPRNCKPDQRDVPANRETTGTGISLALAGYNRVEEDICAILYLLTEKPAALLVTKHEDTTDTSGDGLKAVQELVGKYNKITDEVIRATMEKLVNTSIK